MGEGRGVWVERGHGREGGGGGGGGGAILHYDLK